MSVVILKDTLKRYLSLKNDEKTSFEKERPNESARPIKRIVENTTRRGLMDGVCGGYVVRPITHTISPLRDAYACTGCPMKIHRFRVAVV